MEDYKEKYEIALKTIQEILDSGADSIKMSRLKLRLQSVFSELKESDEKIKEALIALVKCNERCGYSLLNNVSTSSMIAWIEKQGEQIDIANKEYWRGYREGKKEILDKYAELEKQGKEIQSQSYFAPKSASQAIKEIIIDNANKVEPKFKVGDWVLFMNKHESIYQVEKIEDDYYILRHINGGIFKIRTLYDEDLRLWTIKDAEDGDILIDKSNNRESPFIFKETKPSNIKTDCFNPLTVLGYCGIGGVGFTESEGWGDTANCIYYPATKEQRDLLFQKIKESGYNWNSYKKELINIL